MYLKKQNRSSTEHVIRFYFFHDKLYMLVDTRDGKYTNKEKIIIN